MKVARVEATPLAIPLEQEFHWSGGTQRGANLVLFSVHTDDGVVGYGESICEDPVAVVSYGLLMAQHFVGHELANVEAMLRDVWTQGRWRFWPQFTQLTVSGIEVACWDALGRTLGVPTRRLLRRARPRRGRLLRLRPGRHGRAARPRTRGELAALGHEVLYVKLGRTARDDEECVAAIREAIGPDRLLRIDPNEAWSVGEAVERIRRLEPYGIDWVEQPVPAGNVKGLAHVRRSVGTSRSPPTRRCSRPGSCSRCCARRRPTSSSRAPTTPAACCPSASRRRSPRRTASTSTGTPSWRPR